MKWWRRLPGLESESFESDPVSRGVSCVATTRLSGFSMIVRVTLGVVFAAMLALPLHASTRVDLNGGWRFRIDRSEEGETQGWNKTLPPETEVVRVPHTWNIGKYDDYEGVAWYFRTLALSPAVHGQHVELHFAATFYKSRVWLNGKLLGGHEGGYTPYWLDLSSSWQADENFLAIELDNRPTAQTIPGFALRLREGGRIWYDWWHYGGLVRDVWLTINQDGLIRRQRITSSISGQEAQVTSTVFLDNVSRGKKEFRVVADLLAQRNDRGQAANRIGHGAAWRCNSAIPLIHRAPGIVEPRSSGPLSNGCGTS